ncbi:hypothetical protein RQP46_000130 [Phenoliferia psychrophenolica]
MVGARPARLELFKFSLYVFFPIAAMLHFGDPDWYDHYVEPLRPHFVQVDKKQVEPPSTRTELQDKLAKMREERLVKRAERLRDSGLEGGVAEALGAGAGAGADLEIHTIGQTRDPGVVLPSFAALTSLPRTSVRRVVLTGRQTKFSDKDRALFYDSIKGPIEGAIFERSDTRVEDGAPARARGRGRQLHTFSLSSTLSTLRKSDMLPDERTKAALAEEAAKKK